MTNDGFEQQREGLPPGFNINVPLADVGPEDAPLEIAAGTQHDSASLPSPHHDHLCTLDLLLVLMVAGPTLQRQAWSTGGSGYSRSTPR